MNAEVKDYVTRKVNELIETNSCCAEAKEAAKNWLEAVGTEKEAEASKNLIAELEADIMPIDGLIAFCATQKQGLRCLASRRQRRFLPTDKS